MKKGQTLVLLLVFIAIAITITSAAVVMIINSTQASSSFEQSILAYQLAESGAENAILRLLRDPTYTQETLTIGDGTATIEVTGSDPKTIQSTGRLGDFARTVVVTAQDMDGILTVVSWQEQY